MKKLTGLLILLLSLSISQLLSAREIFKGNVAQVEEDVVWIKTNQGRMLSNGSVVYVHDTNDKTIAIMKVSEIRPRYIQAKIIDGCKCDVKLGHKVNNIYDWDGYKYLVDVVYEKGTRKIVLQNELDIDNNVKTSKSGSRKETIIDGREIKTIKVRGSDGRLKVRSIKLKDGRSVSASRTSIESLKSLENKSVKFNVPGVGDIDLSSNDITAINVVRRVQGAKRIMNLHYSMGESALPQKDGEKFNVTFKFLNFDLGMAVLERMISQETDKGKLKFLVANLKLYSEYSVSKVGVAGSFNEWDDSKTPMKKNKQGIYEANVTLDKGSHQYYFVLHFKGTHEMKLHVLDPYSNKVDNVSSASSAGSADEEGSSEGESEEGDSAEGEASESEGESLPGQEEGEGEAAEGEGEAAEGDSGTSEDKAVPEDDDVKETVKEGPTVIEASDSSPGVAGKASVLELPGIKFKKDIDKALRDAKLKEKAKDLPYNPKLIEAEEARIKSKVTIGSSVVIGDKVYYKVKFRFDQLKRIRTHLMRSVNEESIKDEPDNTKIKKYEKVKSTYSEKNVSKVSVVGTFNSWQAGQAALTKGADGVWEVEVYVEKGKHFYRYAIDYGHPDGPYVMDDLFAAKKEADEKGVEMPVLYVGVEAEKKDEGEKTEEGEGEGEATEGEGEAAEGEGESAEEGSGSAEGEGEPAEGEGEPASE